MTVTPWKRYGKDRLYVNAAGTSLGYLDRETGQVHVTDEKDRSVVERLLGVVPAPPAAADDEPYAVTVERWAPDLSQNEAGAGARAKAQEHREQAPVRTLLARVLGVHTDERAWRVGSKGEELVGKELEKLGPAWTVVHDVPVGDRGANIDHVVVGPGGVFTVNAKMHVGKSVWVGGETVIVGGHRTDYVRKARWEAQRASRLMSAAYGSAVPVTALVAVLAADWTVKSQPQDGAVLVLRPSLARKHLTSLAPCWAVHEVDRLALWVRRSTTWQP